MNSAYWADHTGRAALRGSSRPGQFGLDLDSEDPDSGRERAPPPGVAQAGLGIRGRERAAPPGVAQAGPGPISSSRASPTV
jgi:hypothetical protein